MFNRKKYLTLIELVISTAIIGIVSATSMIYIRRVFSKKLDADARGIVSNLRWIREEAAAKHEDYCIRFDTNSYEIYQDSCGVPANSLRRENITSSITAPAAPFDVIFYRFNISPFRLGGTAYSLASVSNELIITLSQTGKTKNVRLFERTGYVKVE